MLSLIHDPFYENQKELLLVYQNILLDAASIVIGVALSSPPGAYKLVQCKGVKRTDIMIDM